MQIRDFVKDIEVELDKPGVNSFGLGDFKAPKVLGDIVESIAGAIFLDKVLDTDKVWEVFSSPAIPHGTDLNEWSIVINIQCRRELHVHKVVTSLELLLFQVFQPLLQPMVTPETLPMHPVRELQERCQQQAEGLEYKASRTGNMAT